MSQPAVWLQQLEAAQARGAKGSTSVGYTECPCEFCDLRFGTERKEFSLWALCAKWFIDAGEEVTE